MVGKKSGFRISKMSLIFYNTGGFKINFFHRIYSVVMSYSPLNSWWYKNCLTVNSIWGSGTTPLTEKKFVKKNSKCNLDDFLLVLPKSYWTTFKTIFEALSARGPVTWPSLEGWYTRNPWFSRFLEYISASFWYFFMKSFLVVRSYRVLVINIKILIMGALATLETRLKVPILAIFWRFWAFLELSV